MRYYKKIFCLVIVFYLSAIVQAYSAELCDCYGNCAMLYPRDVSTETKMFIKQRDGYDIRSRVDIDHRIPLCIGGSNDPANLQSLTKDVHRLKTDHDLLLLYYIKNCYMTLPEAWAEVDNFR